MDYSVITNPFGPPKAFKKIINRKYKNLSTDETGEEYVKAYENATNSISRFHAVLSKQIVLGNGSGELLSLLLRVLKPRRAIIPSPSDSMYFDVCRRSGCESVPLLLSREKEFDLDADDLILKAQGVDMIILANPNNPTSRIIDKGNLKKILD